MTASAVAFRVSQNQLCRSFGYVCRGHLLDGCAARLRAAMTPAVGRVIDTVLDIARRCGTSPTRVATAWCLRLPVVNAAIIGTDTPEQVRQNFRDADWELPAEAAVELTRCSAGLRLAIRKDCPQGWVPDPP